MEARTKSEDSVSTILQKSNKETRLLAAMRLQANYCERIESAEAFWRVTKLESKVLKSGSGRGGGGTNHTWTIAKAPEMFWSRARQTYNERLL